jgi:hypothetical protein
MLGRKSLFLGIVLLASVAFGQTKQQKTAQLLLNAQYVYVEPLLADGKFADLNVSPEDGQAATDISNAIEKWGQYKIAARRSEADLVISVRKGRVASTYSGGHVGIHTSPTGGHPTTEAGPITGGETGPKEDLLWVFALNPDGTLAGPYWKNAQEHGLETPNLALFQLFKKDISEAIAAQNKKKKRKP